MSTWDVFDWQKRFRAAPSVWAVVDRDGLIGNLYVSKEAAMEEVRFPQGPSRRHGDARSLAGPRARAVATGSSSGGDAAPASGGS
jgi:hypothetical protein